MNTALEFIKQEYRKRMEDDRRLHVHYIAARFKKDIKWSWDELKNVLIEGNKKDFKEAARREKKMEQSKQRK